MNIIWSSAGWADVERLYTFLVGQDPDAADTVLDRLVNAPDQLLRFPRRGSRLSEFEPREVREFRIGRYLMRYELADELIYVLRFFHVREDRFSKSDP